MNAGWFTGSHSNPGPTHNEFSYSHETHPWQKHTRALQIQTPRRVGRSSAPLIPSSPSSPSVGHRDIMAVDSVLNDTSTVSEDRHRVPPRGQRSARLPFRERGATTSRESSYKSFVYRPNLATNPSSGGSGSPPGGSGSVPDRREARPPYSPEQKAFIWYHKDDLDHDWDAVTDEYKQRFPRREKTGLQCQYYRFRDQYSALDVRQVRASPHVRQQDPVPYGVVYLTDIRYP